MGLYDRDYAQQGYEPRFSNAPQMRMGLPRITPVVKWLLIINIGVFLAEIIFFGAKQREFTLLKQLFAIYPITLPYALQPWRLITYQFLHWNVWHILLNMIGLYFLGPTLERHWGRKRFLTFYLGCGVAGGGFYLLLVAVNFLSVGPMAGASGAILGMLAACAILFPQFVVFFLFFPVPIRLAAIILIFVYVVNILTGGQNAGGDAAHLAGMVAGAIYVFSEGWRSKFRFKHRSGRWERKMQDQRDLQLELDRILQKVHDYGIHSLTSKEKRTLKKATEAERMRSKL